MTTKQILGDEDRSSNKPSGTMFLGLCIKPDRGSRGGLDRITSLY